MSLFVPLLAAFAFAGAVYALMYPYFSGDREKAKRIETVAAGRGRKIVATETQNSRKKSVAESLKDIDDRQSSDKKLSMALRLRRAGLPYTPRDFYIASAIMGGLLGALLLFGVGAPLLGAAVAAFIGGVGLPRWIINKLTARRQQKFVAQLANAIDVIVRGIKSGLPINDCVQVIARESPEPIASEFREIVEQQRMGVNLAEGLERMCERLPLPEVRFLAIVIAIQQQAGGNLSEALSNLAGVLRDRQMLSLKVKALSAEAKASAMVLASLPPGVMFMVYVTTPDYMMPLFTQPLGRFMIAFGACWMMTGVLIMRKMINFKF